MDREAPSVPDGALYVTNGNAGTLVRIDPRNGSETVVGSGLPLQVIGFGGAIDVAFVDHRAYVLVTAAGSDFGVPDAVMGIYRLKRDGTFSVFADLGTWSARTRPRTLTGTPHKASSTHSMCGATASSSPTPTSDG